MSIITTGTLLALPGDIVLFTSNGLALGTEVSTIISDTILAGSGALYAEATRIDGRAPAREAAFARRGHYRATTYPATIKPWKY